MDSPDPSSEILLTIGIPTYAREAVLIQTLSMALGQMDRSRMELIIVDQTPQHEEAVQAQLERWQAEGLLNWVRMPEPRLMRALNEILLRMRGQYFLLLDDDVLIPPGFFEKHLACYSDASIAGVSGQLFHCRNWADPPDFSEPQRNTVAQYPLDMPPGLIDRFCGGVSSFRKSALLAIGGYDENIIGPSYYWEDDVAKRLLIAGGRILYQPDVWVVHLRAPSGGSRIVGSRLWPEWTKSANYSLAAFRYCKGLAFWNRIWLTIRAGMLRKENVAHPLRWPAAIAGTCRSLYYGWRHRNTLQNVFTHGQDRDWRHILPVPQGPIGSEEPQ